MGVYNLSTLQEECRIVGAHSRPCVSAMLHPLHDVLVTSSGSRIFPDYDVDSSATSGDEDDGCVPPSKRARGPENLDNSIRIWRLNKRISDEAINKGYCCEDGATPQACASDEDCAIS